MPGPFRVVYSEKVRDEILSFLEVAEAAGQIESVSEKLREIDEQMSNDPRQFGDPNFTLRGLKLDMFTRYLAPLVVWYGVHLHKDLVLVKRVFLVLPSQD